MCSIPPLHLGPILRHTVHIIKRQLLPGSNLPDGKQRQVVNVLVRMVAHACKDAQVGIARVVDEARRPGQKLAVHLERRALEARVQRLWVGEFVEGEEVDVLALGDGRGGATAVGFGGGDDLAEVAVDELAFFYGDLGMDSCMIGSVRSARYSLSISLPLSLSLSKMEQIGVFDLPHPLSGVRKICSGIVRPRSTTRLGQSPEHEQPTWHSYSGSLEFSILDLKSPFLAPCE